MKMSFKRYVQNMRMEKAKELLAEQEYHISEISARVGIPTLPTFLRYLSNIQECCPVNTKGVWTDEEENKFQKIFIWNS